MYSYTRQRSEHVPFSEQIHFLDGLLCCYKIASSFKSWVLVTKLIFLLRSAVRYASHRLLRTAWHL
jgi:hypothetical protein